MSATDDPLQAFIQHIEAAGALAHQDAVADVIGRGLQNELAYLLAAVRARCPEQMSGAQQPLL